MLLISKYIFHFNFIYFSPYLLMYYIWCTLDNSKINFWLCPSAKPNALAGWFLRGDTGRSTTSLDIHSCSQHTNPCGPIALSRRTRRRNRYICNHQTEREEKKTLTSLREYRMNVRTKPQSYALTRRLIKAAGSWIRNIL